MNFRIYGKRKDAKRGGAFFGISIDDDLPIFGGSNLIYAPLYFNKSIMEKDEILEYFREKYPTCEFKIKNLNKRKGA